MIKRAREAQIGVNARVIVRRNPWHPLRLHEGQELTTARVKEDVSDLAPFGHLDDVAADDREAHDVFVEVTRAGRGPGSRARCARTLLRGVSGTGESPLCIDISFLVFLTATSHDLSISRLAPRFIDGTDAS